MGHPDVREDPVSLSRARLCSGHAPRASASQHCRCSALGAQWREEDEKLLDKYCVLWGLLCVLRYSLCCALYFNYCLTVQLCM